MADAALEQAATNPKVGAFLAQNRKNLINNEWVDARSGETFDVINPATGGVFARCAASAISGLDRSPLKKPNAAARPFTPPSFAAMIPANSPASRTNTAGRTLSFRIANCPSLIFVRSGSNPCHTASTTSSTRFSAA